MTKYHGVVIRCESAEDAQAVEQALLKTGKLPNTTNWSDMVWRSVQVQKVSTSSNRFVRAWRELIG